MRHRIPNLFVISWLSLQNRGAESFCYSRNLCLWHRNNKCIWFQVSPQYSSKAITRQYGSSNGIDNHPDNRQRQKDANISVAEQAFAVLAKRPRTWRRLRHLVDLAQDVQAQTTHETYNFSSLHSIVDVGTDHGILPIAWAASGQFDRVTGVDVSEQVLQDGARALYQEVADPIEGQPPAGAWMS